MEEIFCVLDYETRSECDLKKSGAFEYSVHPSTKILCVAWRMGTRSTLKKAKTHIWSPYIHGKFAPKELISAIRNPKITKAAHNALFEQYITNNVLFKKYFPDYQNHFSPPEEWFCTAALSRSHACPGKLEQACHALDLPIQKDSTGHRIMLKLSKPRKVTKHNKNKWHNSLADLERVMEYCKIDVGAETELLLRLPPLPPNERKVWILDQKINTRGMPIDRPFVLKVLDLIKIESDNLNKEFNDLTGLGSATRRDAVLQWLRARGVNPPNLQKKTVQDLVASKDIDPVAKRVLEIRLSISKVSIKKYKAFEMRSRFDGRVRDLLVYHVASPGRWGGAGVQPQNLPKQTLEQSQIDLAIEIIKGE